MGSREQENSICLGMGLFQEEKTSLLMLPPWIWQRVGDWECTYPWKCSPKPKAQICHMWKYILIEKLVISYHALSVFIYIHQKLFVKKNHIRLKSPYHVSNPDLGSFSKRVLRLIFLCSTGAIVIGCPSWHHQWPWWDSNSRLRNSYLAIMREIPGSIPALAILGSTLAQSNPI